MDVIDEYVSIETKLEAQVEANQKLFNFLQFKGLVGDFREWNQKTGGLIRLR